MSRKILQVATRALRSSSKLALPKIEGVGRSVISTKPLLRVCNALAPVTRNETLEPGGSSDTSRGRLYCEMHADRVQACNNAYASFRKLAPRTTP